MNRAVKLQVLFLGLQVLSLCHII